MFDSKIYHVFRKNQAKIEKKAYFPGKNACFDDSRTLFAGFPVNGVLWYMLVGGASKLKMSAMADAVEQIMGRDVECVACVGASTLSRGLSCSPVDSVCYMPPFTFGSLKRVVSCENAANLLDFS